MLRGRYVHSCDGERIRGISVVLPAHNEEGNIEPVVRRAVEVMPSVADSYEILIVDDGSRDATGVIADHLASAEPTVRVIHHPRNLGYGRAWRSGIAQAQFPWIFIMDSDRQFDIGEITKFTPVASGYDIVAGYRIARQDPYYRFLVGSCFNLLVTALFDVHLRDIDCGFKMFRASLLDHMTLESPGALINTEIHAKANMAGAKVLEVGINHYPRAVGRQSGTKPKVILRAGMEIVRLRIHIGRYSAAPVRESLAAEAHTKVVDTK